MIGWQTKTIRDLTVLIKDGTHGTHKDVTNGISLLSAKDVRNGSVYIPMEARKISREDFHSIHKTYKLQDGDLLLTIVGSLGRVALVCDYSDNYTLQRSVAILRFNHLVNPRFAYYTLAHHEFQKELLKRESKGAQGGVYLGDIAKIKILVPEKTEQDRIVTVLGVWDEYIEKLEQKIALKENLKKAMMQQLLTGERRLPGFNGKWSTITLNKIGYARTSSVDKLSVGREKSVRLLNYMDVYRKDRISNSDDLQMVTAKDTQIATSDLKKGDVLFTPSSETPTDIGHSAVIVEDLPMTVFSYHLTRLRMKGGYLSVNFAAYCFKTKDFYKELWRRAQGATRFTLSKEALESAKITIPLDIDEQNAIASVVETNDGEINALKVVLREIRLQRKYLLKNLITGTIRTPEDLKPKEAN